MKCPICDVDLTMSERQGIEIDYCPTCRGVWLDRGELDKIIERSNAMVNPNPVNPTPTSAPNTAPNPGHQYGQPQYNPNYNNPDYYYKKKRRKSFLEELFD